MQVVRVENGGITLIRKGGQQARSRIIPCPDQSSAQVRYLADFCPIGICILKILMSHLSSGLVQKLRMVSVPFWNSDVPLNEEVTVAKHEELEEEGNDESFMMWIKYM